MRTLTLFLCLCLPGPAQTPPDGAETFTADTQKLLDSARHLRNRLEVHGATEDELKSADRAVEDIRHLLRSLHKRKQ